MATVLKFLGEFSEFVSCKSQIKHVKGLRQVSLYSGAFLSRSLLTSLEWIDSNLFLSPSSLGVPVLSCDL